MAVPWNETNAAHLLRRAAFGGTAAEIAQAVSDGQIGATDKLLNYEFVPTPDLDARISRQTLDLTTTGGITAWWMTRILYSPRPLEERLTLFWHNHFATAIYKVNSVNFMFRQNQLLRSYANLDFKPMVLELSKDPAMLIWLDNRTNRKGRPNENYGRELLELFTLGHGNYTEDDVLAAAKAFTGWTYDSATGNFLFQDNNHDHSQKTFMGVTGDLNGDDIIRIICTSPAHGRLITSKLFAYFAYPDPPATVIDSLASVYMSSNQNIKALLRAILLHDEMYSPKAIGTQVKSPIDFAVIASHQLMLDNDGVDNDISAQMPLQGMQLYNPPDVDGWDGGLTWINAGTLLNRINLARTLINKYFDPARFLAGEVITNPAHMVDSFLRRLGPLQVPAAVRTQLINYVSPDGLTMPTGTTLLLKQRGLARLIVSQPNWQMY